MPELNLKDLRKDLRLAELRLPEMSRDDIAKALGEARKELRGVRKDLEDFRRDFEMPRVDVTAIEMPRVDIDKVADGARQGAQQVAEMAKQAAKHAPKQAKEGSKQVAKSAREAADSAGLVKPPPPADAVRPRRPRDPWSRGLGADQFTERQAAPARQCRARPRADGGATLCLGPRRRHPGIRRGQDRRREALGLQRRDRLGR